MKRVRLEDAQLEYEEAGTGEPVLLLHGGLVRTVFPNLGELPLTRRYRVISYHRRGFVLTSKDLTDEDRRTLSGRVEQIVEKDSWSHDQLVALVRKLGTRSAVTTKPA